jgi:hypothetical protein
MIAAIQMFGLRNKKPLSDHRVENDDMMRSLGIMPA